jgi:hypothetical protein
MEAQKTLISCPGCGHQFSPEAAIEGHLRKELAKEFNEKYSNEKKLLEQKIQTATAQEFQQKLLAVEAQAKEKTDQLADMQRKELEWKSKERALKEREEQMELTMKQKLLEQEDKIRSEAETRAKQLADIELREKESQLRKERSEFEINLNNKNRAELQRIQEESDMKAREMQKKLDDQTTLVNEMKRKSEQGSMQLQGEVQELALEEYLKVTFPFDEISEVGKGQTGADCIQVVRTHQGKSCGRIIYESKRTKHFGGDWIDKLKADMRAAGCDIAVLVTEAFPKDMTRFGMVEGVWVCSFAEMKSVSLLIRSGLLRVGDAIASQENKGDKMQMLYDYLTGTDFRNYVENAVEVLSSMKGDLDREKKAFYKMWAEREKQNEKLVQSTLQMFGSVKGIAGSSFQDIPQIQLLENGETTLIQ